MFEYDPEKSAANLAKHRIDFEQAQVVWDDDQCLKIAARPGLDGEARALVIGIIADKLWSVVVTIRGDAIRIISARRSRDDEKELYHDQDN
jgi:uncharacterized protein